MKKLYLFLTLLFLTGTIFAQQLSWRFANPYIIKVGAYDNLRFDVQVKCDVSGTYFWAGQVILTFNNSVFTNNSTAAWTVAKVGAFLGDNSQGGAKYAVVKGYGGVAPNLNMGIALVGDINASPLGPNADDFAEITTTWATMMTLTVRLTDVTGDGIAGMDFVEAAMNGEASYISAPDVYTNYPSPCTFDSKDFMADYMGRFYSVAKGWSQVGNATAAQWVNWNNNVSTTIWDGAPDLTTTGGAGLANLPNNTEGKINNLLLKDAASLAGPARSTLTVPASKWLTVAGTITNGNVAPVASDIMVANNGSLKQPNPGVLATVTRNINAGEWHFISAPTSNATSSMFVDQYLQTLNEGSGLYQDLYALGAPLVPGKGYALWSTAGPAVYAGPLNGTATFGYTAGGSGWNLVGNPYASSLDWNVAKTGNPNLLDATYVHVSSAIWAQYVDLVGTNGGTQYIAPGQGFIIKATGPGTLAMNYTAQAHSAQAFYKSTDVVNDMVRLQVSGNGYTDEAVVRFLPEATAQFDGSWDAYKLYGDVAEAAQLYTIGSEPLAINTLPETNIVPAGIHVGTSGIYTIAMTERNDISQVSLEDTKTGIFTDLTKGSYTFNFTAGENEQRFFLHFGTTGVIDNKATIVNIYSYQNTAYINMMNNVKGDIFIYNVTGQLVATRTAAQGSNEIKLSNTGNYIVRVITNDRTVVQKIFIQ